MSINEIISEFQKFDTSVCKLYPRNSLEEIQDLEIKLKYRLPNDFKAFLLLSSGADTYGGEIYGVRKNRKYEDLYGNYISEKDEVDNPIREYYLPISPDGMGNHNCLDLKSISLDGETCNVIFWQHDRFYKPNDEPDLDAKSFTEFLEKILENLSNCYNKDGTEK